MAAFAHVAKHAEPTGNRGPSIALRIHPLLPLLVLGPGVIAQQLTDTGIAPIPNCSPWFCGVARHGGQMVPFFDFALWAGLERLDERVAAMISVTAGSHVLGLLASQSPIVLPADRVVTPWNGTAEALTGHAAGDMAYYFDPSTWLAEIALSIAAEFS